MYSREMEKVICNNIRRRNNGLPFDFISSAMRRDHIDVTEYNKLSAYLIFIFYFNLKLLDCVNEDFSYGCRVPTF